MPAPGFSSSKSEKKVDSNNAPNNPRRDPYEVLGVARNATDQEIKSAYRKLALRYHPDKNANDAAAADVFKEVTFAYSILSDPNKRRQYDTSGFEAIEAEGQELELDLSSLSTVNTMFAALFRQMRSATILASHHSIFVQLLKKVSMTKFHNLFCMLVNLVFQLRQLFLQLFWRRHLMVQLLFFRFRWGSQFLERWKSSARTFIQ
ncbi:hypothetical protein ZIOFF_046348 [Zingiber officinale]|uniref:J domain-containing protein n=1 Tax=Zingiber officinale TaxID=94328 RepID=A0A8J5G0X2_ZINOF|nr:hypothetical protein ZIOFF_046348 [Zingiber officinale]